ncbi:MAG TPA: hypothetical protein VFI01_07760 [Gaiellaceae bacterium]|nr:hypothetical protein [Gaiellaceae bacterium]
MASSPSSSAAFSADPHLVGWKRVEEAILETPGVLPAYVRRAIARGDDPPELAALLAKVRTRAYAIVDRDVAELSADVVLEGALAAALAEADARRRRALKAIG